jgi:hypothetical protein
MEQQQPESSAGEMMVFGLIEQADRMGKSAQGPSHPSWQGSTSASMEWK